MIIINHTQVFGWEAAIRGMRNPMNSWEKSDSYRSRGMLINEDRYEAPGFYIGPNDLNLMKKLCKAGTDHRKFMRMIMVYVDITAPVYWAAELDTYKVATVRNSCSFMHKGVSKIFEKGQFSWHGLDETDPKYVEFVLKKMNELRDKYLETKNAIIFQQLRDICPQGLNIRFTYMCNYEVLANIYKSRKDHKLTEWHEFCDWIKTLPYSELIVGKSDTAAEEKEEHPLPSMNEIDELFVNVMKVDGRVKSYRVHDKTGMKILDFYDANHKSLYAVDLYCTTLDEALVLIKEELVKLTRQNLELGA